MLSSLFVCYSHLFTVVVSVAALIAFAIVLAVANVVVVVVGVVLVVDDDADHAGQCRHDLLAG